MKRIVISLLLAFSAIVANAQKFDYDVNFKYLFNNGSYGMSKDMFEQSTMINSAVLTPWLGLKLDNSEDVTHRIMIGLDLRKDLGVKTKFDSATEILFYYNLEAKTDDGTFFAIVGAFPRTFSEGFYDHAFFSDHNLFNDRFFDGFYLKYRTRKFYAELGADMLSLKQTNERMRFQAMTAGDWNFAGPLSFGWGGRFYYFGESELAPNTVLYGMVNPYIKYSPKIGLDRFDLLFGWIQTYQHDLGFGDVEMPGGASLVQHISNWGLGVENTFYFGNDLMPFYSYSYNDDFYAGNLYFAKAFYHTRINEFSFYDRAEIYYSRDIASWVNVKLAFDFHFANPTKSLSFFRGWQQVLSLTFNL
ncbi:MAG: hypothetical protein MJY53_04200 [Bacteroidales bacterium]|nr:hypothetical protein [Bacteroidales bacterium]